MTDNVLPDGTVLTDQHLLTLQNRAKEVVRTMLERACIPAASHAKKAISEAVAAIVDIYVKYGFVLYGKLKLLKRDKARIDAILEDLRDKLFDLIKAYATADASKEDEDAVLVMLGSEFMGNTAEERLAFGASLLDSKIKKMVGMEALLHDELITSDLTDSLKDVVGIGKLLRLVDTEISRAWQFRWRIDNKDARYVHVFRGSSYDCDICDEIVSLGWQPVEHSITPPIHPNCRCYCVYM